MQEYASEIKSHSDQQYTFFIYYKFVLAGQEITEIPSRLIKLHPTAHEDGSGREGKVVQGCASNEEGAERYNTKTKA